MNKNKIIITILTIIIIIISGLLGYYVAKNENIKTIDGLVITIKSNVDYTSKLIKTFEEYKNILKENGIKIDNEKNIYLTKKDFKKNDYIVDYIPYEKDLEVKTIDVEVLDGGVILNYVLNKEVTDNTKVLLYLIPLDKNQLNEYKLANRNFSYE